MSLPSWTTFFNEGEEVAQMFVNCGWYYADDLVPELFRGILEDKSFPDIWDKVIMYNKEYSKEDVQNMLLTGVYTNEQRQSERYNRGNEKT